jgi:N-sulfoglucosamine sulfohydrolase
MSTKPNILLITADDMNWDAVGAYGCAVPGTTPQLDRLAASGMRFHHAHVTIAVCQPSRSAMMTGRYPHTSGGEGFYRLRDPGVPILPDILRQAGYTVGILGKVGHSTPHEQFSWDMSHDMPELGMGRNPTAYGERAQSFMANAARAGQPFFLMANSHDPHRPFHGNDTAQRYTGTVPALEPSATFAAADVPAPGHLADLPQVRLELAEYYGSVRRCDDTVGRLLAALDASGAAANTLVMFLSDNGMAFPFAKTNCYLHSTRTPWIVRWPQRVAPGALDSQHFVAGIDITPTLLEAAGLEPLSEADGRSFVPLLHGRPQEGREHVFTQFHQTAGKRNYPMRCVQTQRYGYIFNPWADGQREFRNESQAGRTMAAMQAAAAHDQALAARVELFLHRVPEELYDFEADPDALDNRINDPDCQDELQALRQLLEGWMQETADPALTAFRHRGCGEAREQLMAGLAAEIGGE